MTLVYAKDPVAFESFPQGTIVFDLPIGYLGQVLDALVEDADARMHILQFSVTPYNTTDLDTFASDAFKLAIHTPAIGQHPRDDAARQKFGARFADVIRPLLHDCNEPEGGGR